ncbi:MAG: glycyl-radical enzyme activating protein, partial [Oscillospiraceae bacterium]
MKIPNIINIQKFSIHDGDGIRTTLFFKGCPLSCKWCHNPESQSYNKQLMFYQDRCTGCGACIDVCPQKAISFKDGKSITDFSLCNACGKCIDYCSNEARFIIGDNYSTDELAKALYKDYLFYETSGGGVTLSGGEVMCQDMDYIVDLLKKLNRKGVNIAIDTCGYAPFENFEKVMPYTDTFLYDLKAINPQTHLSFMGKDNALILENLEKLAKAGANINIRIPVIDGVNACDEEQDKMIDFVKQKVGLVKVNLLPYHNTGKDKYERISLTYEDALIGKPSDQRMEELKNKWISAGFNNV